VIRLLRRAWAEQRPLLLAFVAALGLTLVFAIAEVRLVERWSDRAGRDPALAGWMTLRYVAHSWNVPPEVITGALALERPPSGKRITLSDLAAARGVPLDSLTATLQTAIDRHRAGP
jgi:hypothetical protein